MVTGDSQYRQVAGAGNGFLTLRVALRLGLFGVLSTLLSTIS